MFVARIKFKVQPVDSYEKNKIYELYNIDNVCCKYRYTQDDEFEFVLGNFEDKEVAFSKGKDLYTALLYLLHLERLPFELEIMNFNEPISIHGGHLHQKTNLIEPEKYYYSNHDFYNDYYGLEIFEINNDFYEEYKKGFNHIHATMSISSDHKYHFDLLQNFNIKYNDDSYRIFKILELIKNENDISIKILILSMAFETISNMELKSIIKRCKESNSLSDIDKIYVEEMMNSEKELSVCKKCHLCIKKFSNQYKHDKKVFNNLYSLRSKVTHGEQISEEDQAYSVFYDAEKLFLKIFKKKFEN